MLSSTLRGSVGATAYQVPRTHTARFQCLRTKPGPRVGAIGLAKIGLAHVGLRLIVVATKMLSCAACPCNAPAEQKQPQYVTECLDRCTRPC